MAYTDRVLLAAMKNRKLEGVALAALLQAVRLLGLAIGTRIAQLRHSDDPLLATAGKLEEQALLIRLHEELRDIVAARWDKLPAHQRPHYSPEQRYRILRVKELLALSRHAIAHLVRVDPATIANWETERAATPDLTTIGNTVKPQPPVRRFADVVRALTQAMALAGFGGNETIARTLARAGWKLSKRTVSRVRREKRIRPPTTPTPPPHKDPRSVVTARHPNHVRMMDFTEVPGLFRIVLFRLVVSFDVFSRMPLAARVTADQPTAAEVVELAQTANNAHGTATYVVTDQGSQFTATLFRAACATTKTKQRYGAVGKSGSIALIERMWRSVKGLGGFIAQPPLTLDDFRRRAELTLRHYAYCRPHRALGGATPAEVYFGLEPAHLNAVYGPRGRPGEGPTSAPFAIAYLDREHRLPILFPKAA